MVSFFEYLAVGRRYVRESSWFGLGALTILISVLLLLPVQSFSVDVTKYAAILLGGALLCFTLRPQTRVIGPRWLLMWAGLWVVWISVVTVSSEDFLYSLIGSGPRYASSWFLYVLFALFTVVVVATGKRYTRAWVFVLCLASSAVAVFGVLESYGIGYYAGPNSLLSFVPLRVPSLLGNPNFSSWFIAAVLPFGLVGLLRAQGPVRKLLWFLFVVICVWSLGIFASRGVILAAALGMAAVGVALLSTRSLKLLAGLFVVAAGSGLLWGTYITAYRTPLGSSTSAATLTADMSATDRFAAWEVARLAIVEHPITGLGPGVFDQYYWQHLPSSLMGGAQYFDDSHNIFLSLLADTGVAGLLLFLVLVAGVGVSAVRLLRRKNGVIDYSVASAIGVFVWLCAGLFNPAITALWPLLAVLVALGVSNAEWNGVSGTVPPYGRFLAGVFGLACFLLATSMIFSEVALVSTISSAARSSVERTQVGVHDYGLLKAAAMLAFYNPEVRLAAIVTDPELGNCAKEVDRVVGLHPRSVRLLMFASEVCADVWQRSRNEADAEASERYLRRALARTTGYPPTYAWAAFFYWQRGDTALSERYARISVITQPSYFYNWLLLAKHYREQNNYQGLQFALEKAWHLAPGDTMLSSIYRRLVQTRDARSINLVPTKPPVLSRLH